MCLYETRQKILQEIIMKKLTQTIAIFLVAHLAQSVSGDRMNRDLDLSGSLLPEEYPDGDVSSYALPVFIQSPENSYTAKGKPAILECRIAHARRAYFVCNDDKKDSTTETNGLTDPKTQANDVTRITLEITRTEVNSGIGEYTCRCKAYSGKGHVESKAVTVSNAFHRKIFEQPPYSQKIKLSGQASLRCHPPKANPPSHVSYWLKNGEKLDTTSDSNFIHSSAGKEKKYFRQYIISYQFARFTSIVKRHLF